MRFLIEKIFCVTLLAAILCSCEANLEENEEQQEDMISFLEDTHSPNLISESELSSSLDLDPPFYTAYAGFTYRYISTYYDAGRDAMAEVVEGSTIEIYYSLYQFDFSTISSTDLVVRSNRADEIAKLVAANSSFDTQLWSTDPLELTIGKSSLLSSIHEALIGCREGDEVYLYMTLNAAYGDDIIGLVEKGSALMFSCTIESVN